MGHNCTHMLTYLIGVCYRAGLRTLPHNAKMHYNYANLQKDLGNTELAKQHYQEAIR